MRIQTGSEPHVRMQLWWRLSAPMTDPEQWSAQIRGLATGLGGDEAVHNPDRLMRLGGTIAWPTKPGRRKVERTLLRVSKLRQVYEPEEIMLRFPPLAAATAPAGIDTSGATVVSQGRIVDGRERYMLTTVAAILIEFIGRNGVTPSPQELFDAAWPQYARKVDLTRSGRGPDEFSAKVRHALRRFEAGEFYVVRDGQRVPLQSLDAVVDWYAAKYRQAHERDPYADPAPPVEEPNDTAQRAHELYWKASVTVPGTGVTVTVNLHVGAAGDVSIAAAILAGTAEAFGTLVFSEGMFWVFHAGYWQELPRNVFEHLVMRFNGKKPDLGESFKIRDATVKSCLALLAKMCWQDKFFAKETPGVTMTDGFVTISDDGELAAQPHSPDDRKRFMVEGKVRDALAVGDPLPEGSILRKLLTGPFRDNPDAQTSIDLIAEIGGVAMLGLSSKLLYRKAFFWFGQSAHNGKNTIARLIASTLPANVVSDISLDHFGKDAMIIKLAGKAFNLSGELEDNAPLSTGNFKNAVTGDPITGRDLYVSAASFVFPGVIVVATNRLPRWSGGMDNGIKRRVSVLPFKRTIPQSEVDPAIVQKVIAHEMPLVIRFFLSGARRVILNGGLYSEPVGAAEAMRDWTRLDNVIAFVEDCVTIVDIPTAGKRADAWHSIKHVYEQYRAWCERGGIEHPLSIERFAPRLYEQPGIEQKRVSGISRVAGVELTLRVD